MKEKVENQQPKPEVKKYNIFQKSTNFIESIFYFLILIPLVIITLSIVYQSITKPKEIPHVFGWKMFMILDENMDDSVDFGDLVFTKNTDINILKTNDLIAFRTPKDNVTIHKIVNITEGQGVDEKTKEIRGIKTFELKTQENETEDTKSVKDFNVEGIIKFKIPKIGAILFYMQQPKILICIIGVILAVGLVFYLIAHRLDKKDERENKAKE